MALVEVEGSAQNLVIFWKEIQQDSLVDETRAVRERAGRAASSI